MRQCIKNKICKIKYKKYGNINIFNDMREK